MAAISFKGRQFTKDMILQSVRWYLAYALSYRNIEERMKERGFSVDHSSINRGSFIIRLSLLKLFNIKRDVQVIDGEWMRLIVKSTANGSIIPEQLINKATRLIFY